MTTIKLQFNEQTSRLQLDGPITWEGLSSMVQHTFSMAATPLLSYIDDEGDQCRITRDVELQEALRISGEQALKVVVHAALPAAGAAASKPASDVVPVPDLSVLSLAEGRDAKKLAKQAKKAAKKQKKEAKKAAKREKKEAKKRNFEGYNEEKAQWKRAKMQKREEMLAQRQANKAAKLAQRNKTLSQASDAEILQACMKMGKLAAKCEKLQMRMNILNKMIKNDFPYRKLVKVHRKASEAAAKSVQKANKSQMRLRAIKQARNIGQREGEAILAPSASTFVLENQLSSSSSSSSSSSESEDNVSAANKA